MDAVELGHVEDDIAALLAGELSRDDTRRVAAHLRSCEVCRDTLVSVAVATGALNAMSRSLEGLDDVDALRSLSSTEDTVSDETLVPLRRPQPMRWLSAAAAAVVLFAALGVGIAVSRRSPSSPTVATAALSHLSAPASASGKATVTLVADVDHMKVATKGLPSAPSGHFYEVWLLQPTTLKMLPLGLLSPTGTGSFTVAPAIMAHYSAVDVSLQSDNGNPAHSKTSELRGVVTITS